MFRDYIQHCHIAFCSCCCKHKCSGFNLIWDYRIICSVKFLNTTDLDHICSGTTDICSHAVEEVCNINNVRFFCNILHNGKSLCHCSCHHNINSCSNTDYIKVNVLSDQAVRFSKNLTIFNLYICSKCTESFQMLIDRSASDITSSRQCNFCMLILSKHSS